MNRSNSRKQFKKEFWWDIKHLEDGSMVIGIEASDKVLTFDGHYVCLFPKKPGEKDLTGSIERAETMLKLMGAK